MKIEVTIYLKSGGNVTMEYDNASLKIVTEEYAEIFNEENKGVLSTQAEGFWTIVPKDNIAIIQMAEVTEQ